MAVEKVKDVAQFLCKEYQKVYGKLLDELKLHSLLYLAQKYYASEENSLLFLEELNGWKFGPVCKDVRKDYKNGEVLGAKVEHLAEEHKELLKRLVITFGKIPSWKLSEQISKDTAYANSRKGLARGVTGDNVIDVNDFNTWSWETL